MDKKQSKMDMEVDSRHQRNFSGFIGSFDWSDSFYNGEQMGKKQDMVQDIMEKMARKKDLVKCCGNYFVCSYFCFLQSLEINI